MATARELLEQADVLMRRNRLRGADREDATSGMPVLTEVLRPAGARPDGERAADTGEDGILPPDATGAMAAAAPAGVALTGKVASANDFDDVPVLTDVVAEPEPISVLGAPEDAGESSQWPGFAARAANPDQWTAAAPADAPMPVREDANLQLPAAFDFSFPSEQATAAALVAGAMTAVPSSSAVAATEDAAGSRGDGSIGGVGDAARWESVAEEVRMQVLQRIDIFTDTGLQEQLAARLQPIVDRASADLVATINQHVGQLLRAYVAEAIEREIDKWRRDGA
jgi:hypothetical protein